MSFMENVYVQIVIAFATAITFMGLIMYMSKHPQKNTTLLKCLFSVMFVVGVIIYCYCHCQSLVLALRGELEKESLKKSLSWVKKDSAWPYYIPYIIMRAVIDVGMMFYGRGNTDLFESLPVSKEPAYVFGFWLIHVIAFGTTASALLIYFGSELRRWGSIIKNKMPYISDIDLIFGINANSLALGRHLADIKCNMLVYVENILKENYESAIRGLGGLIYSDTKALRASVSFLKTIGMKRRRRKLRLFVLSDDYDSNIRYAQMMLKSLEELKIPPTQTELILLGTDESKGMLFQSAGERYGYGNVISFEECEMTARLLIHKYPLCDFINFDANGRASEDVEVLIGGFGRIGHEVLRKVLANGRFEGSRLTVTIFDPKHGDRTGFVRSQYYKMFAMPDAEIGFESKDIRSGECFKYLQEHASKLKYIVICLEDRETARNIALRMVDRLYALKYPQNVYTCDSKSIRCYSHDAEKCEAYWIYDSDLLYSEELDKYAKELHHYYSKYKGNTLEEDWKQCGYFHRMSSRASVDYLIPLLHKITAGTNILTSAQKENLAKCEHLRWCAFHYTFGYEAMEMEEFIARLKKQQAEIQENGSSGITPRQDTEARKHVCLVSWDKLDEISQTENSITHGNRDFKQNDRDNIDTIMELINPEEKKNCSI